MSKEEKLELIADILELEVSDITEDMKLEEIEEWDSLSKLSLMALVKKHFGKKMTQEEIREFTLVSDIVDYME